MMKAPMNRRRLTDLSASYLKNESSHPCGILFQCPVCTGNCWIEARWSDKEDARESLYMKSGKNLEELTLSPGIDTKDQRGCGVLVWVHDGEVCWS